jgi:hypothetical protein
MKTGLSIVQHVLPGVIAAAVAAIVVTAGPLDPPSGTIAPTYKTLTEVEPRIAINATNTPGDAGAQFRITTPGSYYLTESFTIPAGKAGIGITVENVTVDLNGFTITSSSSAAQGVISYGGTKRAIVRNGRIRNALYAGVALGADGLVEDVIVDMVGSSNAAIAVGDRCIIRRCTTTGGLFATVGHGTTVENSSATSCSVGVYGPDMTDVRVTGSRFMGVSASTGSGVSCGNRLYVDDCQLDKFVIPIQGGSGCVVSNTRITNCAIGIALTTNATIRDTTVTTGSSYGISVESGARISGCTVSGTVGGIIFTSDAFVERCTVTGAGTSGFSGTDRNTLIECVAAKNTGGSGFNFNDSNTFTNCRADDNSGDGFFGRFGNVWTLCNARANGFDGIETNSGGMILNCRIDTSGTATTVGANIRMSGGGSRIESNSLVSGDFGIVCSGSGNVIIRNSSRGAATEYSIVSGNDVGPIGTAAAGTSPWANIDY